MKFSFRGLACVAVTQDNIKHNLSLLIIHRSPGWATRQCVAFIVEVNGAKDEV